MTTYIGVHIYRYQYRLPAIGQYRQSGCIQMFQYVSGSLTNEAAETLNGQCQ